MGQVCVGLWGMRHSLHSCLVPGAMCGGRGSRGGGRNPLICTTHLVCYALIRVCVSFISPCMFDSYILGGVCVGWGAGWGSFHTSCVCRLVGEVCVCVCVCGAS